MTFVGQTSWHHAVCNTIYQLFNYVEYQCTRINVHCSVKRCASTHVDCKMFIHWPCSGGTMCVAQCTTVWRLEVHTRPRWQRESLPPVLRSPRLASHCTQHLAMKTVRHPLYDRGHFMVFMKFKDICDKPTADPLLMDLIAGVMNCCAQRTLQKHDILGTAILWKGRLEYPLVAREAKCIPICLLAIYSLH